MTTKTQDFIADLDGGVFEEKIGRVLSEVAAGVVAQGRKGSVTIKFDFKQISESNQVEVSHKLSYDKPTRRGKATEEDTTTTPMYVGNGGDMTIHPIDQLRMDLHADNLGARA